LEQDIISHFLPEGLLLHFSITSFFTLGKVATKKMFFAITLEGDNVILGDVDGSLHESKGFTVVTVQDFPVRGKAVYLKIRRRRWRLKLDPKQIVRNDFSFVAEGAGFTRELSDFLKGTGRYKGGYGIQHRQLF
jgi:hypothetical protein